MIDKQVLRQFSPFDVFNDKTLEAAVERVEARSIPKGTFLFKRGKVVGWRFFLLSGDVDLIDARYERSMVEADSERSRLALNQASPSSVSAIAKTDVVVLCIACEKLDRLLTWSQMNDDDAKNFYQTGEFCVVEELDSDQNDWMSGLLQAPLFKKVPLSQLQELFHAFEDLSVKAGETVIQEGEKGDFFYVIAKGEAHVHNRSGGVDINLVQGQYFGEEALLGNTLRNATVTMYTEGTLKCLSMEHFIDFLKTPVLQYMEASGLDELSRPYKLLDVRMPIEYRLQHLPGSMNIPLSRLRQSLPELGVSNLYLVPDDAGSRADVAAHLLCQAGFDAAILKNAS